MSNYGDYNNNNNSGQQNEEGERGIGQNKNQQQPQQQYGQPQNTGSFSSQHSGPAQSQYGQQQQHSGPAQQQYGQQQYGQQQQHGQQQYGQQQQHGQQQYGQQQQHGQQQYGQQQHGVGQSQYANNPYGNNAPGGNFSQEEIKKNEKNSIIKDYGKKAGIAALGAAAIGAVAYGIHEYREDGNSSSDEESNNKKRREEEEKKKQQQQQSQHYGGGYASPSTDSAYGGSHHQQKPQSPPPQQQQHSNDSGSGFCPPAPLGRPPYSFDQNDVRNADPSRCSQNSPTPHEYPQLHHTGGDNKVKFGSIIALKHNMTGRFLHTDRSHSTQTGSNQQMVFGYRWNTDENDFWQVLPANHDVPVPGANISFGTQIRLRHVQTGTHLHSHYNFRDPKCGQNETTAYGDSMNSDENDHWVVERWGNGAYGQVWDASEVIVLRHYVSGMALHSHDILFSEDVQSVTCFGQGNEENDKWRVQWE
ncbi:hypothetical protein LPJ66_007100 [Kickxella alabastrina]|uniref:Uncharacterized protein n=1 Tax=Kickxella alabastrina TaxID=61397 RepID=A0ACC1IAK0_9FUNG|nr:hypothetical protein LPJ66_007100 [Kickxella alabastrina]